MPTNCPASMHGTEYSGDAISFPAGCRLSMIVLNHFTIMQSSSQFTEGYVTRNHLTFLVQSETPDDDIFWGCHKGNRVCQSKRIFVFKREVENNKHVA